MGIEYASVRMLAREFGQVPQELRAELRPKLRQAGEQVRSQIRSNAGFSSRIPGAVRMTTAFGSKTGGVRIWVDAKKAPHARPLENLGQAGSFRHPVFGNRDVWVSQPAHPFFFPAVKSSGGKVRSLVEDAVRASFPRGTTT
jgi:hypothetical protein